MHFFVASITLEDEATAGRHLSSLKSLFTLLKDPVKVTGYFFPIGGPVHVIHT